MNRNQPVFQTIAWKADSLEILDQTRLPEATCYVPLRDIEAVFEAIQKLRVRGAPLIGITAAYGLYLGMRPHRFGSAPEFFKMLDEKIRFLASARPTAVNLLWALRQLRTKLAAESQNSPEMLQRRLLDMAREIHADDRRRCNLIAEHGQAVVPDGANIITHCNTGALATGGIGTALGVICRAHAAGKRLHVYADETRPVLQGARLTMWELAAARIPAHLICDSMAATLMQQRKADLVIVGADRIAADGSAANKIGTYGLAIAARYHQVPFYVAAPLSTFDLSIATGGEIPIEMRDEEEVRRVFQQTLITLPEVPCWNPAFDVTPPELIAGIITERGVIYPPYRANIQSALA